MLLVYAPSAGSSKLSVALENVFISSKHLSVNAPFTLSTPITTPDETVPLVNYSFDNKVSNT